MKKRIFAIVMAVIMVMTLVVGAIPAMAANDGITVRIHYHRPEGDYEGWELWCWVEGQSQFKVSGTLASDGTATQDPPYKLEEGDGEMVCTINVPTGAMKVGYIVRYGNWENKDVEHDQFINLTGILSGTVDFYVESGVPSQPNKEAVPTMEELTQKEIEYKGKPQKVMVLGDDVVEGVVVVSAAYEPKNSKGNPEIEVQLSKKVDFTVDTTTFTVKGKDGEIAVTDVLKMGTGYYLTLADSLALDQAYNISFEGNDYVVTMPDYYSTSEFESKYTYTGNDLGATYSKTETKLRVWAPLAVGVKVNLYADGNPATQADPDKQVEMTQDVNGTWVATLEGDMNGTYYTYLVDNYTDVQECVDPYARTTGVNGRRGMIIDLDSTDPEGWADDKDPHYDDGITDAIIWELHVRDLSSDASSGIKNKGKFLGLIEAGTKNSFGQPTGLDYMKELGITHIHLLPVYDFGSVDENSLDKEDANLFNWGYDPQNYNVPEGSYSTDPYNGEVRVKEFKQMVKGLHDNGISVIMDVVYNHVYDAGKFCMNNIVPGYFSRPSGSGSGCGNDTASERVMVRKYIVESVLYWADEYHIDGFRFDLAGVLDTVTINEIVKTVHETHPNVIFYGEGWTSGGVQFTKPGMTQAVMANSNKTPNFAYFSDTIRNNLKGGTFGGITAGFISGGGTTELNNCFKGMPSWCTTPAQSINYISAHDNNTLYDHITLVNPSASLQEKADMNKLGVAFYMAAQGTPFMQAGEEIMRSKPSGVTTNGNAADGFFHNSYNAPDSVNSIKWDEMYDVTHIEVLEYYKGMIAFRKAHPALRMDNGTDVSANIFALQGLDSNVLGYRINGGVNGETAEGIVCIYNGNKDAKTVTLPEGEWHICVNKTEAGVYSLGKVSGTVEVEGVSALILVKGDVAEKPAEEIVTPASTNWVIVICVIAAAAILSAAVVILLLKKK